MRDAFAAYSRSCHYRIRKETLRCSWVGISPQEGTVVLGVNWRIADKQNLFLITRPLEPSNARTLLE